MSRVAIASGLPANPCRARSNENAISIAPSTIAVHPSSRGYARPSAIASPKSRENDAAGERPETAGTDLDVPHSLGDAQCLRFLGERRTHPLLGDELDRDAIDRLIDAIDSLSHHRDDDSQSRQGGAHAFRDGAIQSDETHQQEEIGHVLPEVDQLPMVVRGVMGKSRDKVIGLPAPAVEGTGNNAEHQPEHARDRSDAKEIALRVHG